jgi:hypothetical protein
MDNDRRATNVTSDADLCGPHCETIYILERRVNSHAEELVTLKQMLETNSRNTAEVLEIVSLGRSFFRVLGWLGGVLKPLILIIGTIAGVAAWFKTGTYK